MKSLPKYIKQNHKVITLPWPECNPKQIIELKSLGEKLGNVGASLYLIGSASGNEEASLVQDLDLVVIAQNKQSLLEIEQITRNYKKIEGVEISVRYQFYFREQFLTPIISGQLNAVYYTSVLIQNLHLGGNNILEKAKWLNKDILVKSAKSLILDHALMLFRLVNKQKFKKDKNSIILRDLRSMVIVSMLLKGYYGRTKTDIFSDFLKEYEINTTLPIDLLVKSRSLGLKVILNQDPETLQNETLKFTQELINQIELY